MKNLSSILKKVYHRSAQPYVDNVQLAQIISQQQAQHKQLVTTVVDKLKEKHKAYFQDHALAGKIRQFVCAAAATKLGIADELISPPQSDESGNLETSTKAQRQHKLLEEIAPKIGGEKDANILSYEVNKALYAAIEATETSKSGRIA